jgi:hypothetical protein
MFRGSVNLRLTQIMVSADRIRGKDKIIRKTKYEACPESKDSKVLNMYNIFNLQKQHCEWISCT